jgi:hypothetical protein
MAIVLDGAIEYTGSVYLLPYQRGILLEELRVADTLGAATVTLEELLDSMLGGPGRYQLHLRITLETQAVAMRQLQLAHRQAARGSPLAAQTIAAACALLCRSVDQLDQVRRQLQKVGG